MTLLLSILQRVRNANLVTMSNNILFALRGRRTISVQVWVSRTDHTGDVQVPHLIRYLASPFPAAADGLFQESGH